MSTGPRSRPEFSNDEAERQSVWLVRDAGGVEGRHLAEDARRRLQHGEGQARAAAFAEAELEIEDRLEAERVEDHTRGGLSRPVPSEAEVKRAGYELRRREERGAGDDAVDDGHVPELGTHDELIAHEGRYASLYAAWDSRAAMGRAS